MTEPNKGPQEIVGDVNVDDFKSVLVPLAEAARDAFIESDKLDAAPWVNKIYETIGRLHEVAHWAAALADWLEKNEV